VALLLADLHERSGNLEAAEEVCRTAIGANPTATAVADRLMSLLSRQGRHADATRILPNISTTWRPYVSERAGDLMRAIAELERRIRNDIFKKDADARVQMARLSYQQTKNLDQALRYLDEAKTIDPNSRTQAATRAAILTEAGQNAEAIAVLDHYVADHDEFVAYWMRGVFLQEQGELERAEQDFRKLTTFPNSAAAGYELLADFYAGTDRVDQAIAAVEQGLEAFDDHFRLKRRLMQLLFQRGTAADVERADRTLAELREERPDDAELMAVDAVRIVRKGDPNALAMARGMLEKAVELDPLSENAQLALVEVLMQLGDVEAASKQVDAALQVNADNIPLEVAEAQIELALGYASTAFKLANEVLERDPNNTGALVALANAAVRSEDQGLRAQAESRMDAAVQRMPTNEALLIARARLHSALERPGEAIPELEAYCRTEEMASLSAVLTLADSYRLVGDFAQAGAWIDRAEQMDAGNQRVVHARVIWNVDQKLYASLEGISSKYVSASGQSFGIVMEAAGILGSLDSNELKNEGIALLEHAVTLDPDSQQARLNLAVALHEQGELDRAEKVYRALLERHPDTVLALNNLAWLLQDNRQQYDEALALANRGLRVEPDDLYLRDTRATIYEKMGRIDDAVSDLEMIVSMCERIRRDYRTDSPEYAEADRRLDPARRKLAELKQINEAK
jgi:tetratricopeptide (TPR) repeat protein